MKSIIDSNRRKVLALARATARRAKIALPTEEDLVEDEGVYSIDLDIPEDAKSLPPGLTKNLRVPEEKVERLVSEKLKVRASGRSLGDERGGGRPIEIGEVPGGGKDNPGGGKPK